MLKKQIIHIKNQELVKLKPKLIIPDNTSLQLYIWINQKISIQQNIFLKLEKNSRLNMFLMVEKSDKADLKIKIQQDQENSHSSFFCLLQGGLNSEINLEVKNLHQASYCTSKQLIKSLADKNSKLTTLSNVEIQKNISKVETDQKLKNLFLSQDSSIIAIPELKIASQDVSARHGFATSKISPKDYFFLQSRGLNKKQAKKLLIHSFVAEIVNKIINSG